MSGKKPRKGGRSRPRRRAAAAAPIPRILAAVGVLAVLVIGAVLAARYLTAPESRSPSAERKPRAPAAAPAPQAPAKETEPRGSAPALATRSDATGPVPAPKPPAPAPPSASPAPETGPKEKGPLQAALPPVPPERPPLKKPPRVAIIIDDIGHDRPIAEKFIGLNAALTLSILPHSPHQEAIARIARARGVEIMLHLPMEPQEYPEVNPGPGALFTSMSPDELLAALDENLKAVPHVRGVNNHMGSKLTAHSEQLYQVFTVLKRRGLFFVDSRTTDASVCQPSARLLQLPFAQRDVFLDHVQDAAFIRRQIRELVRLAANKGEALGIAHPHPTTYSVLKEMLPELRQQVELVPASRLVRVSE
jgi:polysaccharide deacetylase 2 family uncharacterized protein YibQ